jgi:hypothetical protein
MVEFLPLYQQALTERNIGSGFIAAVLVPYNPDRVLELLHTQFKTPSPQLLPQLNAQIWTTETPHNITQLQQQTRLIKQLLERTAAAVWAVTAIANRGDTQ